METPTPRPLDVDAPSVQTHLAMLQGVIDRLASNSAACKTWCVSIVSALAVVSATANNGKILLVAVVPIVMFGALDAYYLGLERRFRDCYQSFSTKLHKGEAWIEDVFVAPPKLKIRGLFPEALKAAGSFSVWACYAGLAFILWLLRNRLN